ncbi:MAG: hypothetical protein HOV67_13265 [Kribbellaceae bacterium]|nr:hypothetical protein [Kribbellaceae bacterium]
MKTLAIRAHAWVISRSGGPDQTDRGDSPIPTSIIIAGLAAFAVVVVTVVVATGQGFLDKLSTLK